MLVFFLPSDQQPAPCVLCAVLLSCTSWVGLQILNLCWISFNTSTFFHVWQHPLGLPSLPQQESHPPVSTATPSYRLTAYNHQIFCPACTRGATGRGGWFRGVWHYHYYYYDIICQCTTPFIYVYHSTHPSLDTPSGIYAALGI